MCCFPFAAAVTTSPARQVLQFTRDFAAKAPEDLSLLATLWNAPDAEPVPQEYRQTPVIIVAGCYSGPPETAEQVIRPLRETTTPIADLTRPMPFESVQTFLDADYPHGGLYYWKSAYLPELNEPALDLLIGRAAARPSPLSSLDVFFLNGAVTRVPADQTAFARRDMPYLVTIEANWTDPGQSDANIAWTRDTFEDLQPFAHGSYLNFPGFMEDSDKLLQGAYEANYERLGAIKAKYDPDNLFHGVLNIVPRP